MVQPSRHKPATIRNCKNDRIRIFSLNGWLFKWFPDKLHYTHFYKVITCGEIATSSQQKQKKFSISKQEEVFSLTLLLPKERSTRNQPTNISFSDFVMSMSVQSVFVLILKKCLKISIPSLVQSSIQKPASSQCLMFASKINRT